MDAIHLGHIFDRCGGISIKYKSVNVSDEKLPLG